MLTKRTLAFAIAALVVASCGGGGGGVKPNPLPPQSPPGDDSPPQTNQEEVAYERLQDDFFAGGQSVRYDGFRWYDTDPDDKEPFFIEATLPSSETILSQSQGAVFFRWYGTDGSYTEITVQPGEPITFSWVTAGWYVRGCIGASFSGVLTDETIEGDIMQCVWLTWGPESLPKVSDVGSFSVTRQEAGGPAL